MTLDSNTQLVVEALRARSGQFATAAMDLAMGLSGQRQARADVRTDAVKVLDLLINAGKLKANADALERGYLAVTAAGEFIKPPPTEEDTMDEQIPDPDDTETTTETVGDLEVDLVEPGDDDETDAETLADVDRLIQEGAENG